MIFSQGAQRILLKNVICIVDSYFCCSRITSLHIFWHKRGKLKTKIADCLAKFSFIEFNA